MHCRCMTKSPVHLHTRQAAVAVKINISTTTTKCLTHLHSSLMVCRNIAPILQQNWITDISILLQNNNNSRNEGTFIEAQIK